MRLWKLLRVFCGSMKNNRRKPSDDIWKSFGGMGENRKYATRYLIFQSKVMKRKYLTCMRQVEKNIQTFGFYSNTMMNLLMSCKTKLPHQKLWKCFLIYVQIFTFIKQNQGLWKFLLIFMIDGSNTFFHMIKFHFPHMRTTRIFAASTDFPI